MSERTIGMVRAELHLIESQICPLEELVGVLDDGRLLLDTSIIMDRLVAAYPVLKVLAEAGDRRAGQAIEEGEVILLLLQEFLPGFGEKRRGLSFALRRGLIPSLRNRRHALQQELAALEPPEPRAGFLGRLLRPARE